MANILTVDNVVEGELNNLNPLPATQNTLFFLILKGLVRDLNIVIPSRQFSFVQGYNYPGYFYLQPKLCFRTMKQFLNFLSLKYLFVSHFVAQNIFACIKLCHHMNFH